jgi:hypothetical protein
MSDRTSIRPSREAIFFATGSFAGVCSATADFGFDMASSVLRDRPARPFSALLRSMIPHVVRPGIRFWGFDIAKSTFLPQEMPVSLRGGLAGAFGGFIEMGSASLYNLLHTKKTINRPTLSAAAKMTTLHSSKLFLCFGSYTYFANTYSDRLPPRPFTYCLLLGAMAGALGTTLISPVEMYTSAKVPLNFGQVVKVALS